MSRRPSLTAKSAGSALSSEGLARSFSGSRTAEAADQILRLAPGLEEATVAGGAEIAPGLGFWLARLAGVGEGGGRLVVMVAPRAWSFERGRLMARGVLRFGLVPEQLLIVQTRTETEALWALEEVLRSDAADLAIGAVENATLTQTRRLDMAARTSGATAALLRVSPETSWPLSAARRRWRVGALPSAPHPWDPRASGAMRWRAQLARRRDGPPGAWDLEWNDETGRLDLVAGLASDGLGEQARAVASG